MRDIHISIVSHGQQSLIDGLLNDIGSLVSSSRCQVTITYNIPENILLPSSSTFFPINVINNSSPKGFAANQNHAFRSALLPNEQRYFLIINPDVRLEGDAITRLVQILEDNENIGLTAPIVLGVDNSIEDSARELPTPARILAKLFGKRGSWENIKGAQPDWVAGMFMAFRASVDEQIGGFDENYFLYYEDVDICSRLWLEGYLLQTETNTSIVHDAQRKSWRDIRYFRWHIASMLRFFRSDVYRSVKLLHQNRLKLNTLE